MNSSASSSDFNSNGISSLIRSLSPLSILLFLLLNQFLHPSFVDFQFTVFGYTLCFIALLIESCFLFFYKDRRIPPISLDFSLLFVSALFIVNLPHLIQAPSAFFLVFFFMSIQTFGWLFLKNLFSALVFLVYLSFLFPLSLLINYNSFDEQRGLLTAFFFFILTLLFSYSFFFHFIILNFVKDKKRKSINLNRELKPFFDLSLSLGFSRQLKPFLSWFLKYFSKTEDENKKMAQFLSSNKAKKDLKSLQKFILDFIDYIELNSESLELSQLSLKKLLTESLDDLKNHSKKPSNLNLKEVLKFEEDFTLRASALHLKKCFKNIIINSFEACDHLDTTKTEELNIYASHHKKHLVIHFIDSGQGIEEEDQQKAFNPFFSRRLGLRGLGLSYAQKVIELHNGTIQIKTEDKKTLVIVRLPLNQDRKSKSMSFNNSLKKKAA